MAWPWRKSSAVELPGDSESGVTAVIDTPPPIVEDSKESVPMPTRGPTRAPIIAGTEMAEYEAMLADIGIDCCTDLTREKLVAFLRDENIHTYNHAQVVAYLDEKLGEDWEWRGLRQVDADHMPGGSWGYGFGDGDRRIKFADDVYRGVVPLPVLMTVKKIKDACPNVFFYVSARKDEDGDPFLLVTSKWLGRYIVERWDEPNFRER